MTIRDHLYAFLLSLPFILFTLSSNRSSFNLSSLLFFYYCIKYFGLCILISWLFWFMNCMKFIFVSLFVCLFFNNEFNFIVKLSLFISLPKCLALMQTNDNHSNIRSLAGRHLCNYSHIFLLIKSLMPSCTSNVESAFI